MKTRDLDSPGGPSRRGRRALDASNGRRAAFEPSRAGPPSSSKVPRRASFDPRSLTRAEATALRRTIGNAAVGQLGSRGPAAENRTGLSHQSKAGIENLSGLAMDDARALQFAGTGAFSGAGLFRQDHETATAANATDREALRDLKSHDDRRPSRG
jgi:hypothetical protein